MNASPDPPGQADQDVPARPAARATGFAAAIAGEDKFRPADALTVGAVLDAGLPLALFTVVFAAGGQNLTIALWSALGAGAVLAVVRLARREPLQNVVAGLLGLGIAAFLAARSGRAEDVFLPGLWINVIYGSAYLVSILLRWPLIGVVVGLATGQGTAWRADPALLRAYTMASAVWVAMFGLRLAVQVPLYYAGEDWLGWLATARLVMSWPLFLFVVYVSWLIVRPAYRRYQQRLAATDGG